MLSLTRGDFVVFPAQAGVFPRTGRGKSFADSIPRASGGVSGARGFLRRVREYSPRKRGCFRILLVGASRLVVFPAQAGVFPTACSPRSLRRSIPRASGGVSKPKRTIKERTLYSPRKRGCFLRHLFDFVRAKVFPAQAGVFPSRCPCLPPLHCIPRASGGVSTSST